MSKKKESDYYEHLVGPKKRRSVPVHNTTIKVDSSMILEIDWHRYDDEHLRLGNLFIKFKKGKALYKYDDVPESVWEKFKAADSKGRFFIEYIKSHYSFGRV